MDKPSTEAATRAERLGNVDGIVAVAVVFCQCSSKRVAVIG